MSIDEQPTTPDEPTRPSAGAENKSVDNAAQDNPESRADLRADIRVSAPISVLRIVSGLHIGATRPLSAQETVLIGSSGDCDIVLSDPGVAPRHAFLTRMGGTVSLRALDAPLLIEGQTLHPGDPAELSAMQRVDLGGASIAVGASDDPGWTTMLPNLGEAAKPAKSSMRHLPLIAGLAALSLVSVAIAAAVMPGFEKQPTPKEVVQPLIKEFSIAGGRLIENEDGSLVLSGTVKDAAVREMIRKRLLTDEVDARLDLRTGDDIAGDVREVLRSQGLTTQTRYLGNGDVEVTGRFENEDAFKRAVASRAMQDVNGVRRVLPRNLADEGHVAGPTVATPEVKKAPVTATPTRIVQIVRGANPHVIDIDGNEYADGDILPDGRKVVGIGGEKAWTLNRLTGMPEQLKPQPLTAEEKAAAAAATSGTAAVTPAVSAPATSAPAATAAGPAGATLSAISAAPAKPVPTAPATPAGKSSNVAEAPARPAGSRQ